MRINVKTSIRKQKRDFLNTLGNDLLRYIAELLTNADDSYKRLKAESSSSDKKQIIIELKAERRNGEQRYAVSVTDNAEGMTKKRLEEVFSVYGNDNASGTTSNARGIFGQGASDVLRSAAYENLTAKIETIKDGKYSKLIYRMNGNFESNIDVDSPKLSPKQMESLRKSLSISKNGTKITFGIPSNVIIRKNTIENLPELINKYPAFRYLLNQDDLVVFYKHGKRKEVLSSEKYQFSNFDKLSDDAFSFTFDNKPVNCRLRTYLNDNKKIDGTNIIVRDEEFRVYDNTMFDYRVTSGAQNISGELVINGLYEICHDHLNSDNPDAIILDNRTGFDTKNPFYLALDRELHQYLDPVVANNEKGSETTNLNNNKNINNALKKLNQYLKSELKEDITDDGGQGDKGVTPPPEGIKFARSSIAITSGKQYDLRLLINPELISTSESIEIFCDSDNIEYSPASLQYNDDDIENGIASKSITISGINITDESAIITATVGERRAAATIDVIDEEIHYPSGGLEFFPNPVSLYGVREHKIRLFVDSDIVPLDSIISLTCDRLICPKSVMFSNANLINRTIGVIDIPISGGEIGGKYPIRASFAGINADALIAILEKTKNDPNNSGLISGIELKQVKNMHFQSYFDYRTRKIVINTENVINKIILGSMDGVDKDNPKFGTKLAKHISDIVANQAAIVLVKGKNIRNNEFDTADFETSFDAAQSEIQLQKNKIFELFYPTMLGDMSKGD